MVDIGTEGGAERDSRTEEERRRIEEERQRSMMTKNEFVTECTLLIADVKKDIVKERLRVLELLRQADNKNG